MRPPIIHDGAPSAPAGWDGRALEGAAVRAAAAPHRAAGGLGAHSHMRAAVATGAHASCTRTHDGAPPATAGAGRVLEGDAERAEAGLVGPASDLGALASHHGHAVATGTQAEQEASRLRELAHVGAATGRRCPHHPRWEKSGVIAATRARGAARARSSACVCCADVGSLRISETNRNRGGASPLGRPKASLRESRSERLRQHLGSTPSRCVERVGSGVESVLE